MRCTLYEIEFESSYYNLNDLLIDIFNWTYMKYYMLFERSDIPIFCGALVVEDSTVIIHPFQGWISSFIQIQMEYPVKTEASVQMF